MANFLRKTAEAIGKAIPNEFSKLNSFSRFVPGIGPYLQAVSAIDAGATAYGDTGKPFLGAQAGLQGYRGSIDPGQYGSGYMRTGQPTPNADWWNRIGSIGNMLPGPSGKPGDLPANARITDADGNLMYRDDGRRFLSDSELKNQNFMNIMYDIGDILKSGPSQQNQMSETDLMMKQIRSLYAQYLFSQNQAALNPASSQSGSYLPYVQTINPGYRL